MVLVTVGIVSGAAVALFLRRRGSGLSVAYVTATMGTFWAVGAFWSARASEGLAGVPSLLGGAVAFYGVALPAVIVVVLLEVRRRRSDPADRRGQRSPDGGRRDTQR